ncbi:zinc finger BED domain-containing protein RICESLEEPER 2-like protein, partial [Tanacetum coccineum]
SKGLQGRNNHRLSCMMLMKWLQSFIGAGGNVVVSYASIHHDIPMVVNVSGRCKMDRGIEERLGKRQPGKNEKDGFIDIKSKTDSDATVETGIANIEFSLYDVIQKMLSSQAFVKLLKHLGSHLLKHFNRRTNPLVSTLASESAFSISGRLISPHRSRLHPKTLEALMCAQSWLLNEIRETCSEETEAYCRTIEFDYDVEEKSIKGSGTTSFG